MPQLQEENAVIRNEMAGDHGKLHILLRMMIFLVRMGR